jgi:hypothetical protein
MDKSRDTREYRNVTEGEFRGVSEGQYYHRADESMQYKRGEFPG